MFRFACATALVFAASTLPSLSRSRVVGWKCVGFQKPDRDLSQPSRFMVKGAFTLPYVTPIGDVLIASTDPDDATTFGSPRAPLRVPETEAFVAYDEARESFQVSVRPEDHEDRSVSIRTGRGGESMSVEIGRASREFQRPRCRFDSEAFAEDDWSWPGP